MRFHVIQRDVRSFCHRKNAADGIEDLNGYNVSERREVQISPMVAICYCIQSG